MADDILHRTHTHWRLDSKTKTPRNTCTRLFTSNNEIASRASVPNYENEYSDPTHTQSRAPHTVVRRDNAERRANTQTTQRIKGIERINRTSAATQQNEFRRVQCK